MSRCFGAAFAFAIRSVSLRWIGNLRTTFVLSQILCSTVWGQNAVFTDQLVFYIPFSVASTNSQKAHLPIEAVLYVSGDQGRTWHAYQTRPLRDGRFSFRAGADGEFWFTVRTQTVGQPLGSLTFAQPEVRVIVDRQRPEIQLRLSSGVAGTIQATWTAVETNLDPDGIELYYRSGSDQRWVPILGINKAFGKTPDGAWSGTTTFPLPVGGSITEVRLSVRDKAGNVSVVETPWQPADMVPPHGNDSAASPLMSLSAGSPPFGPVASPSSPGPLNSPDASEQSNPASPSHSASPFVPASPYIPASPSVPANTSVPASPYSATVGSDPESVPNNPLPGQDESGWAHSSFRPAQVPDGALHRMSRSRRFQLDYAIENAQAGGVHRVEVWHTHDGGRSWRHYGDDSDCQSPFVVEVPGDGLYGFRLLIQAREGLIVQPPRSGDPADVWVTVDAQLPQAKITAARFLKGTSPAPLRIEWQASDANLAETPVTLFFGPTADGPWRKIVAHVANTGNYDWQFDDRVPQEFYLRLEVQDLAGNIGVHVLQSPIRRDGFMPQGIIRDVRPAQYRAFAR